MDIDAYLSEINLLLERRVIPNLEAHNENLEQVLDNMAMWRRLMARGDNKPKDGRLRAMPKLRELTCLPRAPAVPSGDKQASQASHAPAGPTSMVLRPLTQHVPRKAPDLTLRPLNRRA